MPCDKANKYLLLKMSLIKELEHTFLKVIYKMIRIGIVAPICAGKQTLRSNYFSVLHSAVNV